MANPERKPQQRKKARVLIVDEGLDHVRSLALLFDTMGYHVDYAINATTALDIALRFRPDVIFLDLLLPDGHGAKLCAALRECSELHDTRIFGMSASARMLDHQMALDAGCNDVLRKPITPQTFERLIAGGMSRKKLRDLLSKERGPASWN
jgi:CheY-like chemotaxis protein